MRKVRPSIGFFHVDPEEGPETSVEEIPKEIIRHRRATRWPEER